MFLFSVMKGEYNMIGKRKYLALGLTALGLAIAFGIAVFAFNSEKSTAQASGSLTKPVTTDINEIRNSLHKKLERQPTEDEVRFSLALALKSNGDIKGYFREMAEAVRLSPDNHVYRYDLSMVYKKQGDYKQALDNASTAAKLSEKSDMKGYTPMYNELVGDIQKEMGKPLEAEKSYELALAQMSAYAPDVVGALNNPYETVQADRQALENKLKWVQIELAPTRPTDDWMKQNLPWAESSPEPQSITFAKSQIKALERKVRSGEISGSGPHLTLGTYYATVGHNNDAVVELLAAFKTAEPEEIDHIMWNILGWAYLRQHRLKDATEAFKTSVKLGDQKFEDQTKEITKAATCWESSVSGKNNTPKQ